MFNRRSGSTARLSRQPSGLERMSVVRDRIRGRPGRRDRRSQRRPVWVIPDGGAAGDFHRWAFLGLASTAVGPVKGRNGGWSAHLKLRVGVSLPLAVPCSTTLPSRRQAAIAVREASVSGARPIRDVEPSISSARAGRRAPKILPAWSFPSALSLLALAGSYPAASEL